MTRVSVGIRAPEDLVADLLVTPEPDDQTATGSENRL
jgi:hypothetical protein